MYLLKYGKVQSGKCWFQTAGVSGVSVCREKDGANRVQAVVE